MFEKIRSTWSKAIEPLVLRLGNLDPNVLTWGSLIVALLAFWLLAGAGLDGNGATMIGGAVLLIMLAGVLDVAETASGFHTPGFLAAEVDEARLIAQAAEAGVVLAPLSRYCLEPIAEKGLVLGFGSATPDQIRSGIETLRRLPEIAGKLV